MTDASAFRRDGYAVIPNLIEPALVRFFWSYVHTKFASQLLSSGDARLPNTPGRYGDQAFDGLLEHVRPEVERYCGLALYPTFSYFRLYKRGDVLSRHRDRPACEISVSLNIGQVPDAPWPLHLETAAGAVAASLGPGEGLLYRGHDQAHWREAFAGTQMVQVFLHYVDRNGPFANLKFDERPTLMRRPEKPQTVP
jgi:hypothetical protein